MFGNLGKMMRIAGELKRRMPEIREHLQETYFTGAAAEGQIAARVNGRGELAEVSIAPELLAAGADAAVLSEQVTAAVAEAQAQAAVAVREAMLEITGGEELPEMSGLL